MEGPATPASPILPPAPGDPPLPPSPLAWYAPEAEVDATHVARLELRPALWTLASILVTLSLGWYLCDVGCHALEVGVMSRHHDDLPVGFFTLTGDGVATATLVPVTVALVSFLLLNLLAPRTGGLRLRFPEKRVWRGGIRVLRSVGAASALKVALLMGGLVTLAMIAPLFGLMAVLAVMGQGGPPYGFWGDVLPYIICIGGEVALALLLTLLLYNLLARCWGGIRFECRDGSPVGHSLPREPEPERLRIRTIGFLQPSIIGAVLGAVGIGAIYVALEWDSPYAWDQPGLLVVGFLAYAAISFALTGLLVGLLNLAGLITGGLEVEVE